MTLCLVFISSSTLATAEEAASESAVKARKEDPKSASYRDYDLKNLSVLTWNTPTIVNKKDGNELKLLPEIRFFLHNNFSPKELRDTAMRDVVDNHNISAAVFLGLSAIYVLPSIESHEVMIFLRKNIEGLKKNQGSDPLKAEKLTSLDSMVASYFSLEESVNGRVKKMKIMLGAQDPDELLKMEDEVLASDDDEMKFVYISCRLMEQKILPEKIQREIVQLAKSSRISRELYHSMRAMAELAQYGYSDIAAHQLFYNVELGCPYGLIAARSIASMVTKNRSRLILFLFII